MNLDECDVTSFGNQPTMGTGLMPYNTILGRGWCNVQGVHDALGEARRETAGSVASFCDSTV